MLNINKGHNQDILNKCQALFQYSDFIAKIKELRNSFPIQNAIDKAVNYAITNNYLNGFFKKHKEGIMYSCLTEFNEEAFLKDIHDEGYNEGYDEGFNTAIIKCIQKSKAKNISIDDAITIIMEYFDLSKQEASALVKEYWN